MLRTVSQQSSQWQKQRLLQAWRRGYGSGAPEVIEAPMLGRLRSELKTAMKAKDTQRLNVVKSLLSNIKNAEKDNRAFDTDTKIRKQLLKLAAEQRVSARQFEEHKRSDLAEKEMQQVSILEGYAAEVKVASKEDLKQAITKVQEDLKTDGTKINVKSVLVALEKQDGPLKGEPFDSTEAIALIKEATT